MKRYYIKHLLLIFVAILSIFLFSSCKKEDKPNVLAIYNVNDFHGALTESNGKYGAARMADFIKKDRANYDKSVVLSSGDMFQGSALSNYDHGQTVIKVMNEIGFDAMVIGNHEFDWELSTITNLANGFAHFPMLGCNIIQKSTNELPNKVDPYVVLNKNGVKVGIIGYMGYGLEYSIAEEMVKDYQFTEPVEVIKGLAKKLRLEEQCDVIICIGHDASDVTNSGLASLSGDERIDCIINGHTHVQYADYLKRDDGYDVPVIQSGSVGQYVGKILINLDKNNNVVSAFSKNESMKRYAGKDQNVLNIVDKLVEETKPIFGRVLCVAGEDINKYDGVKWAANALMEASECSVAFINGGGIRTYAFPIKKDSEVTVSKVFEIMPFDNVIKTCKLQGKYIKLLYGINDVYASNSLTKDVNDYYINGVLVEDEEYYTVSAVDYIFDKPDYPFVYGKDVEVLGLFRDALINNLEQLGLSGQKWYVEN